MFLLGSQSDQVELEVLVFLLGSQSDQVEELVGTLGLEVVVVLDEAHGSQALSACGAAATMLKNETNVAPDPRTKDEEGILLKE